MVRTVPTKWRKRFSRLDKAASARRQSPLHRVRRRRRKIYKARQDPFVEFQREDDFIRRFRLPKWCVLAISDEFEGSPFCTTEGDPRGGGLPIRQKVCIALRYLATGANFEVIRDSQGIKGLSTVSRCVNEFIGYLNAIFKKHITFPRGHAVRTSTNKFEAEFGIPGVVAALDGTYVPILKPIANEAAYLTRHHYHGLNVLEYIGLSPPKKDVTWTKQQSLYAVKFLYIYTTDFDKLTEADIPEALKAVDDCCRFIQTHSNNPKDSQTAEKLLYHVLTKALKTGHLVLSVPLAKCLAVFLRADGRQGDANVQKIGPAAYQALWNAAIQAEKTNNADAELCLRLRHQAMVHLLLSSHATDRGQDVTTWTINHYACVISKLKPGPIYVLKACEDMVAMVSDLCSVITQRLAPGVTPGEESSYVEMYIAMHLHLVSFLLAHHCTVLCPVIINRLTVFLFARSTTQSAHTAATTSLHAILPPLVNVIVSLSHFTSSSSAHPTDKSCGSVAQAVSMVREAHTQLRLLQTHSPLLVKILHSAIRLALHLPEDAVSSGGKLSKFDFVKMPENLEKEVLCLHGVVAKFYEASAQATGVEKVLAHLHFSHVKVLQFRLHAVASRMDRMKDLKHAFVQEELPVMYLDLARLDAALVMSGNVTITQGGATTVSRDSTTMHGDATTVQTDATTDDLYTLAGLSYKFGRLFYYRGLYSEAAGFLLMCLEQFQRWLKYPGTEPPGNLNLWKKAEMLADCQRRTGHAEMALHTLAAGLYTEPTRLANAADLWVRCKLDMAKTIPNTTNTRSLWSYLSESGVSPLDADQVLNAELTTYKKFRTSPPLLVHAIVDELVTVTADRPAAHAPALLEKAMLLWVARNQEPVAMSAEMCCREAAVLLEGVLVDEHSAHCTVLNDLARAYMCCHIVADVDPLKLLEESKETKAPEKPDVTDDGEEEDTEAYHDCCTLDMEHCASKMADLALGLWEQVAASASVLKLEKQRLGTTIEYVSILADIYRLSHRVSEEYRVLVVLTRLATPADHPLMYLRAHTDLALLYTRLNQPHLALPVIEAISSWLQEEGPKTCLATAQHIYFHLAATEAHLQAGQVTLGCEAIAKAIKIKNENFKSNSTDTLTLEARISRMAATILTLPPSYHQDSLPDCFLDDNFENAFELEVKGMRSISGVVCFMMGEWLVRRKGTNDKVPVNTLSKWALLDELVSSLHSAGATCVRLGEASEARFYLQQGLKLAQGFHLPRRFAAFHLELSHLDSVSARFTDSQSHMNVAFYTLNSADPGRRVAPTTSTNPPGTNETRIEDSDDEMTIKSRPIEMLEMLEEAAEASQNVIGSPTARRWKPHAASCWSHATDCDCWQCADVFGHHLHLLHLAQQAHCLFQQGLHVQAEAFWNLLLLNFDSVTNRARHTVRKLMPHAPNRKGTDDTANMPKNMDSKLRGKSMQVDANVNPSMFQRLLVTVCEQLTELAVSQENWELYEQWVSKALDLLSTDTYPWMMACHTSLAHTLYLRVLPAIPLPQVQDKSHLQELCDRMRQVKVSKFTLDEETKNIETPSVDAITPDIPAADTPTAEMPTETTPTEATQKVESSQNAPKRKKKSSGSDIVKAPGRSSKKASQSVASDVSGAATSKTTIRTGVSPLPNKKKSPPEKLPNQSKASYKTPARKMRGSNTSGAKDLAPKSYLPMFKTPQGVSSNRRAVLDMLINSDSDEDVPKSVKVSTARKQRAALGLQSAPPVRKTGQQKTTCPADKTKTLMTPNVRFDLLSPSGGNKMNKKSPVAALFKAGFNRSVTMEMESENVYDFVQSSPEETPLAARGKKKPSKPGRKPGAARARKSARKSSNEPDIEVKREHSEAQSSHFVSSSDVMVADCTNEELDYLNDVTSKRNEAKKPSESIRKKTSPKEKFEAEPETMGKRTRVSRLVLTRSKTTTLENNREAYSSDESLSLSFDTSISMPDEDSSSDPIRHCSPSPAQNQSSPYSCDVNESGFCNPTSEFRTERASCFIVPSLSPVKVARSCMYEPPLEAVEEEDPTLLLEDNTHLDIPPAWLEEPVEVMRGDTEVKPVGKTARTTQKLKSKRTGKVVKQDMGTEVPRLSTPLPKQSSDGESKKTVEKETSFEEKNIASTTPCEPVPEDLCRHLDQAFALLSHHPTPIPYRKVCHAQALVELARPCPAPWSLAFYLAEAHAVSFRYRALSNIRRKIRKLPGDDEPGPDAQVQLARLQQMQKEIVFGQTVADLKAAVNGLPADWTVVQVSVLATVGEPRGCLVITRFTAGEEPIVMQLPGFATTPGQKLLQDFSTILKSNHTTMAVTNKVEWWSQRHALNERIKEVLDDMEGRWLGAWVGLLQGRPDNDEDEARLVKATAVLTKGLQGLTEGLKCKAQRPISHQLVKLLLRSYHLLEQRHVASLVCELCRVSVDDDLTTELISKVRRVAKSLNLAASMHCRPVLLVLDRAVQHLPWESLPSVRGQPLTRALSLHFLWAHLGALRSDPKSVFNMGLDRQKTYYVLNPDDNLANTQAAFEARFRAERGWKGVVGKPPTSDEFTAGLTASDLFIYCGHGGGAKFLPGTQLAALRCHAAVLLMGCSSGKLVVDGQLEATGMMLSYFLAGCPCIAACLWDVTDKDIDRFLEDLLDRCQKAAPRTSLLDCVHQSRDVCRLSYLIGAAPAVYGLPVTLRGTAA